MSNISLRLPESLHEQARELAEHDHVSLNQFITLALAEKVSVMLASNYLATRAKRASREKFLEAMAQVPDVEPEEQDKL